MPIVRRLDRRAVVASILVGALLIASLAVMFRASESRFEPTARANPVVDLLGWLPATDQSRRAYAAWVEQPGAPLDLTGAIDRLSITPAPLALGRSVEWQRTTGISASQITGWASAPAAGVTVLQGAIDPSTIASHLAGAGYERSRHRSVTIWRRPEPVTDGRIIEGDDLRALNAIALYQDRAVIGTNLRAVQLALDAATGAAPSLAGEAILATTNITPNLSGIMVLDQRDLAVACGVGRGWLTRDFDEPSGRDLAILYHLDQAADAPVTSVWVEFGDDLAAEAALPKFQADWRFGYVNQTGFGGLASDLATADSVRQIDAYVVADLVAGRDNGWARSGVRYLIAICEQASTVIPRGAPDRATPVASPSPVEAP